MHVLNYLDQRILALWLHSQQIMCGLRRTEERRILDQIVVNAHECNACLIELVNFTLSYTSKDLEVVKQKLCIALKVLFVLSIYH